MNPYQELATSIVIRAVEDYRMALRGIRSDKDTSPAQSIRDCTMFFRSEWFKILSNLDGEFIMRKLKEEYEEESNASNT